MNDFLTRIQKLSPKQVSLLALDLQTRLKRYERLETEPIAVIGLGCRFPGGADSPDAFWQLLEGGVDAISEVPPERWDIDAFFDPDTQAPGKMVSRWGGFLEKIDQFDAGFFGIAPREAVSMDPQQRILLEVVWEAIEHAGQSPDKLMGSRTGVFVGMCAGDYYHQVLQGSPDQFDAYLVSGSAPSMAAGRISYLLGLQGPSFVLDTACSSSLVAVHVACQSLRNGECDMALAGGTNLMLNPEPTIGLSKAGMLSPEGRCKSFDAAANGFVRGEGCGVVLLKRLSEAQTNGDNILAMVRGSAVNQDGRSSGITAPNGPAQEAVIRQALAKARVRPADVDYIETHGTATNLGDPIEVRALANVFGPERSMDHPVRIGSVKTNFGHLEISAGIAGFIKVVLALHHQQIPPHLHLEQLNPHIQWDRVPVTVATRNTPWLKGEKRRFAGVSSFGFSGTNAHVVLEEAPKSSAETGRPAGLNLLTLSAKSEPALRKLADGYARDIEEHASRAIGDVCFTANAGRAHFGHRLAVVGPSAEQIREDLAAFSAGGSGTNLQSGRCNAANPPEVVFLFTGQGAQYNDMGRQLYATEPVFRTALDRCAQILAPYIEPSLISILYPTAGPSAESTLLLNQTAFTQPAIFALDYALSELWRSWGVQPAAVMGHSLGEYVAACVAGVFSPEDGLKLVAARARLMQALPEGGAMAAVFADELRVHAALEPYRQTVSISAMNGPDNTVISGAGDDIQSILDYFEQHGIGSKRLSVSHAFHSPLMDPMLDALEKAADAVTYSRPDIELVANVTGKPARGADCASGAYWRRHARQPVRFADSMQQLYGDGHRIFLEIGPHPILTGMASRFISDPQSVWLPSLRQGHDEWQQLLKSLGTLYIKGLEIDWEAWARYGSKQRVILPTYPFQRKRYWIESSRRTRDAAVLAESVQWRDWLYAFSWEKAGPAEQEDTDADDGFWIILCDAGDTGRNLAEELRSRGRTCITAIKGTTFGLVDEASFSIRARNPDDYRRLIDAANDAAEDRCRGVIHCWALDENLPATEGAAELDRIQESICGSALYLTQALLKHQTTTQPTLHLLTRGAQAVESAGGALSVLQTTLAGLARVIAIEHPEFKCKCIDLDPQPAANEVHRLAAMMLAPEAQEHQMALRHDQWWVPRLVQKDAPVAPPSRLPRGLRADGAYLVTGGLAGLGLHLAQWLVEKGARHLILMGRSGASETAVKAIAQMRQEGARIVIAQGDVSVPEDVESAIRSPQGDPEVPLRGVFHCAGALDDGILLQQNWNRFRTVMAAKVQGAWNLHVQTQKHTLDCFVLFSSAAAMLGSAGQANYSAANSFLDGLAHYRHRLGLPGLSINWGAWGKVGMASRRGVVARLQVQGQRAIEPEQGLAVLEYLLGSDTAQVGVLPFNWTTLLSQFGHRPEMQLLKRLQLSEPDAGAPAAEELQPQRFLQQWTATPAGKRRKLLMEKVRFEATQALGLQPVDQIEMDQSLTELGLDSLMGVQLRNALSVLTEQPLPATLLFNYPSIDQLVNYLDGVLKPEQEGPDAMGPAERDDLKTDKNPSSTAEELDRLSENEIVNLLADKLKQI